jgi:two-component system phosphate regulon sensor histidine kinase PhoR
MKKDKGIWILISGLIVAGLAAGLLSVCLAWGTWVSVSALVVAFVAALLLSVMLWCHLSKISLISATLDQEGTLVPADAKGSVFEEIIQSLSSLQKELEDEVQDVKRENSDLSLQLQLVNRRKSSVESILNSIRDAVIVTDDQDRVILANQSSESLFDFTFDKDNPVSVEDIMEKHELVWLISKSRQSKAAHVRHELTFDKDQGPVTFDTVLSCVEDDTGNVCQVVTVLHDITREKEISQQKNDFVSHVSHELKTPLASINAYAEMLVDGEAEDTETIQQFCSVIQGQAQRLNRLIEDILNISRIESGLIKVSKETHSLALVVRDSVEMITSYAAEKNITVHSPAPILYDQVYIDRDMVSQVVVNLLSNAVKYTTGGGTVTVNSELNESEGRIKVTVTDTGVGIPAEDVDHVFDKFFRVEANNKYAKGTGLGLNLVKQIVETVHGGSVFVTSVQGQGSTFGFELPLSVENAAQST